MGGTSHGRRISWHISWKTSRMQSSRRACRDRAGRHRACMRRTSGSRGRGGALWLNRSLLLQCYGHRGRDIAFSKLRRLNRQGHPVVSTTASTRRRLNDSTSHENPRFNSLGHPPFALIAAQPSAPAPPHVCREQAKHPCIAYRTHSARAGPLPVPEHARTPVSPLARRRRPQVLTHFCSQTRDSSSNSYTAIDKPLYPGPATEGVNFTTSCNFAFVRYIRAWSSFRCGPQWVCADIKLWSWNFTLSCG